ncbi:MAG: DUF421 domain-containing protein [Clostridiales bacterium]|nr:DUF421 domain-containing protein [Clostridiales bacterium]
MFISFLRTLILYPMLLLVVRLMGKRQLGQMEPAEFVVAMLLADLAAVPMQDIGIPLLSGLLPILTVLSLELLLAIASLRSIRLRQLLCGRPVILVEDGQIQQLNLKRTRVTLDELTEHLRQKDVTDITTVKYAILETDGNLSVLLHPKDSPPTAKDLGVQVDKLELPLTIISDGRLLTNNLDKAMRDRIWLDKQLKRFGCELEEVFLLTVEPTGKVYFARREDLT